MARDGYILFNPVGAIHYRNLELFEGHLGGFKIRCILNPRLPWFMKKGNVKYEHFYFKNDRVPPRAFEDVKAVVVFSAQPRAPSTCLMQEAAFRSIPVIGIEEVYQMMLEQGYVSEYSLPIDHLFVCSDYERQRFIEVGLPAEVAQTTGCIFRYGSPKKEETEAARLLRERLGISETRPVATLSLAYLTPSGETLEIRRRLLELVSEGLPEEYQLIIKPHPGEFDKDVETFIREHAPRAKVADRFTPIQEILDITDILFNRGNSQVMINALQKNIPVVAVPMGRPIFLRGLLDGIIADTKEGIPKAIGLIKKQGMSLYNPLFEKFLYMSPEEARTKVNSAIRNIAEKEIVHEPKTRLVDIALFWALQGYTSQAIKVLARLDGNDRSGSELRRKISGLISGKASHEDIAALRRWADKPYRQWLIQSLRIKSLFLSGETIPEEEKVWLSDFPPRLNRENFVPYAIMLCWCFLRAGMNSDCSSLISRLGGEYDFLDNMKGVLDAASGRRSAIGGYTLAKRRYLMEKFLRNAAWEAGSLLN